jgi:hypothetical protein
MALENVSVIPYARANDVEFYGNSLRPDRNANFFLDDTEVTNFVQYASLIENATSNVVPTFVKGEGVYCAAANSYATVIKAVPEYGLYVNDNYISLTILPHGANTLSSNEYTKGDVVFQSDNSRNINENTFRGRVEHWNLTTRNLILSPLEGTVSLASDERIIFNTNGTKIANASAVVVGTKFPTGQSIVSTTTPSKTITISGYRHSHGVISVLNSNSNQVNVASNLSSTMVGKNFRITGGTGLNQVRVIQSITNNTVLTLSSAVSNITGTSKYSIDEAVVDDFGGIAGILNLPETDQHRFRSGDRVFGITDANDILDTDATMKAFARYSAGGLLVEKVAPQIPERRDPDPPKPPEPPVTPVIPPTPPPPPPPPPAITPPAVRPPVRNIFNRFEASRPGQGRDPVAQTFFTPNPTENSTNGGMFVSSIDLFFRAKPGTSSDDTRLPVTVRIVTTLNGYPTEQIIAQSTVQAADVKVSNGTTVFPNASNLTKFPFRDLVYLEPNTEYAIVVYSESPDYEVWIAELGENIIGDVNNRRVSEQPYIGSFFRSQNASTWTPYQNQDLMFTINRAKFASSQATLNFKVEKPASNVYFDSLILNSSQLQLPGTTIDYGIKSTALGTLTIDADYVPIDPNAPYNYSNKANTSVSEGKRQVVLAGNEDSLLARVILNADENEISPIFNAENFDLLVSQNIINNGEIRADNITITSPGTHTTAENIVVTISPSDLYPEERATANVLPSGIVDNKLVAINIINGSRGYVNSPTITIQEVGSSSNATAVITGEDSKFGGNALARYITRKVTLADGFDAGDLRVTLRAIRPQGTNIEVYYKALSESDTQSFNDLRWKRMFLENDELSPDAITPVDFVYRPSLSQNKLSYIENGITYPLGGKFKYFSIKIVLYAECGCVSPTVRNLRAIALPEG